MVSNLRRMVDRNASGGHRSLPAKVLTAMVFVLVSAGCTKSGGSVVSVADDFTGAGSLAFVEGDSTVHCFLTKAGASYTFTGLLRNTSGDSVQVEPVAGSKYTMKFADPSSEDTGGSTFIAPHGTVPFEITFVSKASTTEYDLDSFSPAVTVDGQRTVTKLPFPYLVRFQMAGAGTSACAPKG